MERIEKAFEADSLSYERLDIEIDPLGRIESDDQKIILIKVYSLRKYVLFDKEKNELATLESSRLKSNIVNLRFAKFYLNKIVVGFSDFAGDEYIEHFDLNGKSIGLVKGVIPGNQNTNRFDLDNDVIVLITIKRSLFEIWKYNIKLDELIELAELPSEAESYFGVRRTRNLPIISIDSSDKKIILTKLFNKLNRDSTIIDGYEKHLHKIKPIEIHEENEEEIVFKY
ncbi:MAG: hypothetical protein AB8F74_19550 [Saprospiraceae bacterium]